MIGVNIDVTERKPAEEALRNSEKLAATGRLAATIAHEINNPLEAVGNLIFLVQQDSGLTDAATGYLKMADQELERVTRIARQTLGFYRNTSAPVHINIRECGRNAVAVIGDGDAHEFLAAMRNRTGTKRDHRPVGRSVHGIGEQV